MERIALGWDAAPLPRLVDALLDRFAGLGEAASAGEAGAAEAVDLDGVVVVLPGRRSSRRLIQALADRAQALGRAGLIPPRTATPGDLPELLYQPTAPIADATFSLRVWADVLRHAGAATLEPVVPSPPSPDDWRAWDGMAREFDGLRAQLAAEGRRFADVPDVGVMLDFPDHARWEAMAKLEAAYEARLAELGHTDLHQARLTALAAGQATATGPIVVAACLDLPAIARRMLEAVADQVTVFVPAPDAALDLFDELGCVAPEAWEQASAPAIDRLVVADRPRDQAAAVVAALQGAATRWAADQPTALRIDQVTVGLADEALAPRVVDALGLSQVRARPSAGPRAAYSRPGLALRRVAEYVLAPRLDTLAELARCPEVEAWIGRHRPGLGRRGVCARLDDYISRRMVGPLPAPVGPPSEADGDSPADAADPPDGAPADAGQAVDAGEERVAVPSGRRDDWVIEAALEALDRLLPASWDQPRPLSAWAPDVAEMLSRLFGHAPLDPDDPEQALVIAALDVYGEGLGRLAPLADHPEIDPPVSLADALNHLLAATADRTLPLEGDAEAVELLGWLELPLDDAPVLVVVGMNEGALPASQGIEPFLPDPLRRALGLMDHARRLARDRAALRILAHSRQELHLIAGRRSDEGDPLLPSRLLMDVPPDQLPARVLAFYDDAITEPRPIPPMLTPGPGNRFLIPAPQPPQPPIDRLSVTAFKAYLTCPYRFYLRYVRRLSGVYPPPRELDAARFGELMHTALAGLAEDPVTAHGGDVEAIERLLHVKLDQAVSATFGAKPPPVAGFQIQHMRYRLSGVARRQAELADQGWRIREVEASFEKTLTVDDQPFTLHGKIDRIDELPDGRIALIDYKTSESAVDPDKAHQSGDGWVDLQLPLYARLLDAADATLAYLTVGRNDEQIALKPASWTPDVVVEAWDVADEVIRLVRRGVFWPPEVSKYEDEFSGLCLDRVEGRAAVIAASRAQAAERGAP